MKQEQEYLVPDYYPDFVCKMGKCRTSCCEGWSVSLSMKDYFELLGLECSPALRERLDRSLRMLTQPTPERYAEIAHRYDGSCPLRLEDGRCALHAEAGEDALPYVCRLYPRGVRQEGDFGCSCANSCEAVVEKLFCHEEPIRFIRQKQTFLLPDVAGNPLYFEDDPQKQAIRLYLISLMQDRRFALPLRIIRLGLTMKALDPALKDEDNEAIQRILDRKAELDMPHSTLVKLEPLSAGLMAVEKLMDQLDARSQSIQTYGETATAYFGRDGHLERYAAARAHFDLIAPKWPIWLENLLVNHMFFTRFPFSDRRESLHDEFIAICSVYTLLRYLGIGWMAEREDVDSLMDVAAAAFRLIDHTSFHRYSAQIMREIGCSTAEALFSVLSL